MAESGDPWNWAAIGTGVGMFFSGIAATLGLRRRAGNGQKNSEIRELHDKVHAMSKDIEILQRDLGTDAENLQRFKSRQETMAADIYGELKAVNKVLTEVCTEVRLAIGKGPG